MAYGIGTDYAHGERMDPPETGEGWEAERRAEDEHAEGLPVRGECHWRETEYSWSSECGFKWVLEDDGPAANGMHYCPKCGRKLIDDSEEHRDVDD